MTPKRNTSKNRVKVARAALLTATSLIAFAAPALADSQADSLDFIIVSDDIRKQVTEVARPAGDTNSPPASPDAGADAGSGSGQGNNGHGNNADGVDSSNPGQGGGGPNGGVDASGDVDDEMGGGGASPSKGKGKNK